MNVKMYTHSTYIVTVDIVEIVVCFFFCLFQTFQLVTTHRAIWNDCWLKRQKNGTLESISIAINWFQILMIRIVENKKIVSLIWYITWVRMTLENTQINPEVKCLSNFFLFELKTLSFQLISTVFSNLIFIGSKPPLRLLINIIGFLIFNWTSSTIESYLFVFPPRSKICEPRQLNVILSGIFSKKNSS